MGALHVLLNVDVEVSAKPAASLSKMPMIKYVEEMERKKSHTIINSVGDTRKHSKIYGSKSTKTVAHTQIGCC